MSCSDFDSTLDDGRILPSPEPPKRRVRFSIILGIIAGLLTLLVAVGLMTNWYGLYGPGTKILLGANRLLHSKSFTVQLHTGIALGNRGEPTLKTVTAQVLIDYRREDLTIAIFDKDGTLTAAVYKGYYLKYLSRKQTYTATDVSDDIEELFDGMDDFDLEEFLLEVGGQELCDELDFHQLKKSLLSLFAKSNSHRWLEKNAGFTSQKANGITTYSFDPDLYVLCDAALKEFEDAFRDRNDYINRRDSLKELISSMGNADITASVSIGRGRLTSASLALDVGIIDYSASMDISRVGSTVIDTEALDSILSNANYKD